MQLPCNEQPLDRLSIVLAADLHSNPAQEAFANGSSSTLSNCCARRRRCRPDSTRHPHESFAPRPYRRRPRFLRFSKSLVETQQRRRLNRPCCERSRGYCCINRTNRTGLPSGRAVSRRSAVAITRPREILSVPRYRSTEFTSDRARS